MFEQDADCGFFPKEPVADSMSRLEGVVLQPNLAHHYIWELTRKSEEGHEVYIDVHNFRKVRITNIFPTIVRVIENTPAGKHVDIYSIDNNGNCLAHTYISRPDGRKVETRDTSLERLRPYEDDILKAPKLSVWARLRLENAFRNYERRSA